MWYAPYNSCRSATSWCLNTALLTPLLLMITAHLENPSDDRALRGDGRLAGVHISLILGNQRGGLELAAKGEREQTSVGEHERALVNLQQPVLPPSQARGHGGTKEEHAQVTFQGEDEAQGGGEAW